MTHAIDDSVRVLSAMRCQDLLFHTCRAMIVRMVDRERRGIKH